MTVQPVCVRLPAVPAFPKSPSPRRENKRAGALDTASIARILSHLASPSPQDAWAEFLDLHTPLILQVVRIFERDADHISDCYLFICEQLSRDRCKRLRRFRPDGPARFTTWLRAVVRNLCLDWHRKEFGRHRVLESIGRLNALDQEVFRLALEGGAGEEEVLHALAPRFPGLKRDQVVQSLERIHSQLTPRQRWLLAARSGRRADPNDSATEMEELAGMLPDSRPNPEAWTAQREERGHLEKALARLAPGDRLLVQFRYEQDLSLEEVARLAGLDNAQQADRRIREVLERMKKEMT